MFMNNTALKTTNAPHIRVGKVTNLELDNLANLCEATELAIQDGIGFNWLTPPARQVLESYWKGVLVVPQRILIGAWIDGTLCGSIQLVKPSKSKETTAFRATIEAHFVAPWARGYGIAITLLEQAEREAAIEGFTTIHLSVRETQNRAIKIYQDHGYEQWGVLPCHERVGGEMLAGHFFHKTLQLPSSME